MKFKNATIGRYIYNSSRLMSHRKIEYLHRNKIIYSRKPINDEPTEKFEWGGYYEYGTYECYDLFRSKALINTFKSLKWHFYVLWYLNPNLTKESFLNIAKYISNKDNGFTTFTIKESILLSMVNEVMAMDLEIPPPNKLRKIIFKDNCKLNFNQKLSIVGKIIGKKKLSESDIYEAMLYLYDSNKKITISKIAKALNTTTRTIYRNINEDLKKEKELLNKELLIKNDK